MMKYISRRRFLKVVRFIGVASIIAQFKSESFTEKLFIKAISNPYTKVELANPTWYLVDCDAANPQSGVGTPDDPFGSVQHALDTIARNEKWGDRIIIKPSAMTESPEPSWWLHL